MPNRSNVHALFAATVALAATATAQTPDVRGIAYREVARAGDPVPGLGAGFTFAEFLVSRLDDAGRVVFSAIIDGPGIGPFDFFINSVLIEASPEGDLTLLARSGDPVPGTSFEYLPVVATEQALLTQAGTTVFVPIVSPIGGGVAQSPFVLAFGDQGVAIVVGAGDDAPGFTVGTTIVEIDQRHLTVAGDDALIFTARIAGPGVNEDNDTVLYRLGPDGAASIIAREGDDIPGLPAGTNTYSLERLGVVSNRSGDLALVDQARRPNSAVEDRIIIGPDGADGFTTIHRSFDPLPNAPSGTNLQVLGISAIADDGTVYVGGRVFDPGFATDPTLTSEALLAGDAATGLRVLLRNGAPGVLGLPGEPTIRAVPASAAGFPNARGEVVTQATLDGTAGEATSSILVINPEGEIRARVVTGDIPVNVGPGRFVDPRNPVINDNSWTAAPMSLRQPGGPVQLGLGLANPQGDAWLVAAQGLSIDEDNDPATPPALVTTITEGFAPRGGRRNFLNSQNQVVFAATFDNAPAGLFVAEVADPRPRCNPADVALPLGIVDLADADAYIAAFLSVVNGADLAPQGGIIDLDDIDAFIAAFLTGCP